MIFATPPKRQPKRSGELPCKRSADAGGPAGERKERGEYAKYVKVRYVVQDALLPCSLKYARCGGFYPFGDPADPFEALSRCAGFGR